MLKKQFTLLSLVGLQALLFTSSSAAQPAEAPGAVVPPPATMDKIAKAADVPYRPMPGGKLVKFNLEEADLAELVQYISVLTGRRFIVNPKLRTIKATVTSPAPVTLEEAYQVFLSILDINGMTVIPRGRFLKIVDSGGITAQPTPVIARGAPVPETDTYVTRLYRLAHISPDEAVKVLTKFKSKDGDISTYAPGNLLIITDTGTQIARLVRLLEEVDVGGAGQQMWIQPVNGDADELAKRVNELFSVGKDPNAPGALSKVVADAKSNSLIIVGTNDSYLRLLELLKRLDEKKPGMSGRVRVVPVEHAVAQELATTLTAMLAATGKDAAADGGGMFEGVVKVTADVPTNSLVITSSGRDYATLRGVLDQLDRERRQVYIEAIIMDLSVSDEATFGLAFHGGKKFGDGSAVGNSTLLGGFDAKTSAFFPNADALTGSALGLKGPDIPGLKVLGQSIPAFGVVMQAMASSGKSNILAAPHIIATDNVQAEINIGENIPLQQNVGGSALSSLAGGAAAGAQGAALLGALGGGGFSSPRQDVGNRIRITPHINQSNQVRLEIDQESSAAGAASGTLGAVSITKRTAQTTLVVDDQRTVVIGGLTRDELQTSREKVPILGDIPVLGALFRRTQTRKAKTNLLLILTPYVIRSQDDLRKIYERKMQERQEFLDRNFVFSGEDWKAPRDYSRSNGLIEDVRQSSFEMAEAARLEAEAQPSVSEKHLPLSPIDLPSDSPTGGAAAPAVPAAPVPQPPAPATQNSMPVDTEAASAQASTDGEPAGPLRLVRMARNVDAGQ